MKQILLITLLFFSLITSGCNSQNDYSADEIVDALVYAEKTFREEENVTASSFNNEYAKFRIMADNDTTNELAEQLVKKFINNFESMLTDKDGFYLSHTIIFDIKSNEDGEILYKGKKDESNNEIWWIRPMLLQR